MEKKQNLSGLHKATAFVENLVPSLIDKLGYPILNTHPGSVDVRFDTCYVITDFIPLHFPGIEYRMYAEKDHLVFIYTFYNDED